MDDVNAAIENKARRVKLHEYMATPGTGGKKISVISVEKDELLEVSCREFGIVIEPLNNAFRIYFKKNGLRESVVV